MHHLFYLSHSLTLSLSFSLSLSLSLSLCVCVCVFVCGFRSFHSPLVVQVDEVVFKSLVRVTHIRIVPLYVADSKMPEFSGFTSPGSFQLDIFGGDWNNPQCKANTKPYHFFRRIFVLVLTLYTTVGFFLLLSTHLACHALKYHACQNSAQLCITRHRVEIASVLIRNQLY